MNKGWVKGLYYLWTKCFFSVLNHWFDVMALFGKSLKNLIEREKNIWGLYPVVLRTVLMCLQDLGVLVVSYCCQTQASHIQSICSNPLIHLLDPLRNVSGNEMLRIAVVMQCRFIDPAYLVQNKSKLCFGGLFCIYNLVAYVLYD